MSDDAEVYFNAWKHVIGSQVTVYCRKVNEKLISIAAVSQPHGSFDHRLDSYRLFFNLWI